MLIESFAGYSNLGWHLWCLRDYGTSAKVILAYKISIKKSDAVLIGLLYMLTNIFYIDLLSHRINTYRKTYSSELYLYLL